MAACSASLAALLVASSLGQLQEYRPLPELRANEVEPECRVLTPKNARTFAKEEPLAVGEHLTVILPVQLSTAYTWREVKAPESVLEPIRTAEGKDDLRSPSRGHGTGDGKGVGGVDAVQVFRYRVKSAARRVSLRFELVRSFDGSTDGKGFEVVLSTQARR